MLTNTHELSNKHSNPNCAKPLLPAVFSFTHKVCPICKQNKVVDDFATYFSKSRNKYRISNYCKPCGRKEAKLRAVQNYKDNLELRKQYAKDYRANPENKEKRKKLEIYFDEANKINFESYREINSRAKRIILDYNPNQNYLKL